ncbi:hypothetical protein MTO96_004051 [Rhipicephalus appendiculatus]
MICMTLAPAVINVRGLQDVEVHGVVGSAITTLKAKAMRKYELRATCVQATAVTALPCTTQQVGVGSMKALDQVAGFANLRSLMVSLGPGHRFLRREFSLTEAAHQIYRTSKIWP